MPIMYVNPAPARGHRAASGARRSKKVRRVKRISRVASVLQKPSRRRKSAAKRKNAASRRATKKKGNSMARKLFGAAAKAHAKRLAKLHRKRKRKNPSRKRRHARRRRNPVSVNPSRRRRKRRNPGMAANPRRRHARRHRNPDRSKHRLTEWDWMDAEPKSRRRRRKGKKMSIEARRARARRRYRLKHPGAKRRSGVRALSRARRSIKRARKYGGRARAYARRYHMRTNPRRARRARRRRRNPSLMGTSNMLMKAVKVAVPVAASLYLTRFIIAKVSPSIPMVDRLGVFQKPAVAGLMVVAASYASKTKMLSKYRDGIMLGVSLNLVDTLIKAFAPDGVKSMFGLGDSGLYDQAMGEYATVGDYLQVGDEPIDDDITLSDYVETSGVEEELGAMQEELGVEEELGASGVGPRLLGGVSQGSMLKALKPMSAVGVVPQRSFVKAVPAAGAGYDNPAALYTGIFSGGW